MRKRLYSTLSQYIKGEEDEIKLCKNCKYFMKDKFYLPFSENRFSYGKCTKVYKLDLITGKEYYNYASTTRSYDCLGKWFQKKESIF